MSVLVRIAVIIACLAFVVVVARLVAKGKLMLRYSLLWLFMAVLVLFCAIVPGPLFSLAAFAGFENASNFIYFLGLFFLLGVSLSLTVIVSKQSDRIKRLVQEVAILKVQTEENAAEDPEKEDL